ncbi:MAG: hypothetical protein EBE86_035295 [Hormoscilla sp. GUM202]|nr:hypothetical protein [Hormoscilla sp. GUM202]
MNKARLRGLDYKSEMHPHITPGLSYVAYLIISAIALGAYPSVLRLSPPYWGSVPWCDRRI